jgi:hypothetical protein
MLMIYVAWRQQLTVILRAAFSTVANVDIAIAKIAPAMESACCQCGWSKNQREVRCKLI